MMLFSNLAMLRSFLQCSGRSCLVLPSVLLGVTRDLPPQKALKVWEELRLPPEHPQYESVGGSAPRQLCGGELIRFRSVTGICNDIRNPLMGSTGQPFARNVDFETASPDLAINDLARNRHGDRIGLLKPDPQVISRKLLTRLQAKPEKCPRMDLWTRLSRRIGVTSAGRRH